jgi:hypothetical protein
MKEHKRIARNTLATEELRFDPYPGFVLWLFVSNMIQIFLNTTTAGLAGITNKGDRL